MSDGEAKESVKFLCEKDNLQVERKKKKKSGIDEFSRAIARIAVAQICENIGFQGIQESALGTLADVGVRYIREVGRSAGFYANLANRSQCNAYDVIQALEDLGSVQGFSSASDVGHSLSESGAFRDVSHYVGQAEEIPFAYSIPSFPIVKERRLNPGLSQAGENPPDEHIPSWLPKFPDPQTYVHLNLCEETDAETLMENKIQRVEHHRKVERSLSNVQKQLFCNRYETDLAEQENSAKAQRTADSNPFLVPPLQFGEKEVSLPVLPAKHWNQVSGNHQPRKVLENKVSISNSSLPAVDSIERDSSGPKDMRKIVLNGRPSVHFKFGDSKKLLASAVSPCNKDIEKISLWFGNDLDGRDQKKTREEQSIQNPQEVSDLRS